MQRYSRKIKNVNLLVLGRKHGRNLLKPMFHIAEDWLKLNFFIMNLIKQPVCNKAYWLLVVIILMLIVSYLLII